MIKSLNKAYEDDEFIYMCNSCGDINVPDKPAEVGDISLLTLKEKILYERYWQDGSGFWMYVLRFKNGDPAIGISLLFDVGWCEELFNQEVDSLHRASTDELKKEWMSSLYLAVEDITETVIQPRLPDLDIYLGKDTDPDGHEMLVVVPYNRRGELEDITKKLDDVYELVGSAV